MYIVSQSLLRAFLNEKLQPDQRVSLVTEENIKENTNAKGKRKRYKQFFSLGCSQVINKKSLVTDTSEKMLKKINPIPKVTKPPRNSNVNVYLMEDSFSDENCSDFVIQKSKKSFVSKNIMLIASSVGISTALHGKRATGFNLTDGLFRQIQRCNQNDTQSNSRHVQPVEKQWTVLKIHINNHYKNRRLQNIIYWDITIHVEKTVK
ncbi:hypothetical protein V1477_010395 [Vespula maculifrons]|uniref:Uncharacterized protein n=1 Tax=Vespula maculifrons TaxID=7453 RepID=A0ABD2C8L5_VESMC